MDGRDWAAHFASSSYPRDPVDYLVFADWQEDQGDVLGASDVRRKAQFWRLVQHLGVRPYQYRDELLRKTCYCWYCQTDRIETITEESSRATLPKEIFNLLFIDDGFQGYFAQGRTSNVYTAYSEENAWLVLEIAYWDWRNAQGDIEWPQS